MAETMQGSSSRSNIVRLGGGQAGEGSYRAFPTEPSTRANFGDLQPRKTPSISAYLLQSSKPRPCFFPGDVFNPDGGAVKFKVRSVRWEPEGWLYGIDAEVGDTPAV